jgi:hypothetical protein
LSSCKGCVINETSIHCTLRIIYVHKIIRVWYKNIKDINVDYLKVLKIGKSTPVAFNFTYNAKKNIWQVNVDQELEYKNITEEEILKILTEEIYLQKHVKDVEFADYDENELLYANLKIKARQNKPIPRAYLMAYELMMKL